MSARICRSPSDRFRAREPIDEPTKGASEGPLALHSPPLSACLSGDAEPLHKATAPTDATPAESCDRRMVGNGPQRTTDVTEQY